MNNLPPKIAKGLFDILLPKKEREFLMGDLEYLFQEKNQKRGRVYSAIWYWFQIFILIPSLYYNSFHWGVAMFRNYLKIGLRNLQKHKSYSSINIFGLLIGLTSCMLIYLYVGHELSYDEYHSDGDRIYRIALDIKAKNSNPVFAYTTSMLAPALKTNYPEVEFAVRVLTTSNVLVRKDEKIFYEKNYMWTESDLFKILNIPLIKGDINTLLAAPNSLVISKRMAKKYFGNEDPIGEMLVINNTEYGITGIVENSPANTHLKYDLIASILRFEEVDWWTNWSYSQVYTYVKLREDADAKAFENQIVHIADQHVKEELDTYGYTFTYFLQNVSDLHLFSNYNGNPLRFEPEPAGNINSLATLSAVGFLILIIAAINFINLTTAKSTMRAKEVGIRRLTGGKPSQLMTQFMGESLILALITLLLSILLVIMMLPLFNELTELNFELADVINPGNLISFLILGIFMGLLAGIYPAFILSNFHPLNVLRGTFKMNPKGGLFRKFLVVSQFSIAIILIICTLTVNKQINFMLEQELGFDKEQKLIIPLGGGISIRDNYETVIEGFASHPNISGISVSSSVPGRGMSTWSTRLSDKNDQTDQVMYCLYCDYNFINDYDISLIAGRKFTLERSASDIESAYIINEAAVEAFGFDTNEEALHQRIISGYNQRESEIIGVVENFHYSGLQNKVDPLIIEYSPSQFRIITASMTGGDVSETIEFIENKWRELFPQNPLNYFFLDELFNKQYQEDKKLEKIFSLFAFLGLFVSSIGLFGLTFFSTIRRTKEIGIRKVAGASVFSILRLLSKEFILLIIISSSIAWPVAWYIINSWLENFAYKIDLSIMVFLVSTIISISVAIITISYQTIKAARANPVDSLKYE